jgi:rhodanese-related sulfurtransferase
LDQGCSWIAFGVKIRQLTTWHAANNTPEWRMDFLTLEIDVEHANRLVEEGDGQLVDVRLAEELEFFNEIPEALHFPFGVIQKLAGHDVDEAYAAEVTDFTVQEIGDLYADMLRSAWGNKTLLVVCRSGNRSIAATKLLRSLGYPMAYSVSGGVLAWEEKGYKITHK